MLFFFSSRRRHTRCALVTGVQTCALPIYFTASRGFRFGGPQIAASTPTTTVPPVYKSDSLWNYELGLRTDWLKRSLQIDISAYHIDWKNPQVYQKSADNLVNFIDNVGGVQGNGRSEEHTSELKSLMRISYA